MTTRAADERINATQATGAYFGNELSGGASGDYLLDLSDIPWAEGVATGAGHRMVFCLHSDLATDADRAAPAEGEYTFDATSTGAAFTFDDKLSFWNEADEAGIEAGSGQFTQGSLTIGRDEDGTYRIEGYVTTDRDEIYALAWRGPIEWTDRTTPPMKDQQVELNEALVFYGGVDHLRNPDTDHWKIELYDDTSHATRGLMLDFYTSVAADPLAPELPKGTFSAGSDEGVEAGTYVPGSLLLTNLLGTYLVTIIRDHYQYYYCNGGSFTISDEAGEAVIDCDLTTTIGTKVTGTYRGNPTIENEFRPIRNEDLDFVADRLHNEGITYLKLGGLHNYLFMLCDARIVDGVPVEGGPANLVSIDLYSDVAPADGNPAVPEGTYTFSRPNKAGTFSRAFTYGYHWNDEGRQSQKIMLKEGTLTLTRSGETYSLLLDAVTDQNKRLVCRYEGPLPYRKAAAAGRKAAVAPRPTTPFHALRTPLARSSSVVAPAAGSPLRKAMSE